MARNENWSFVHISAAIHPAMSLITSAALFEADRRFLKNAPTFWPVFVIVTIDVGDSRLNFDSDAFNAFVKDFVARGGSVHTVAIKGPNAALISELMLNFTQNVGGIYEGIAASTAIPDKLKTIAARIAADRKAMATRYEVEWAVDPKAPVQPIEVRVKRDGAVIQLSARRPF